MNLITSELAMSELLLSQRGGVISNIIKNQLLELIQQHTVNLKVIRAVQEFAESYLLKYNLSNCMVKANCYYPSPLVVMNYAVLEGTRLERVTRSDFRVTSLFTR